MFTEADGPTALRREFLCALSVSLNAEELSRPGGAGLFCAAIAAVWNGKKGVVVLLYRHTEERILIRNQFDGPLASEAAVLEAFDEGIELAESTGFTMDAPDFADLGDEQQAARLAIWNTVRKVKKRLGHLTPSSPEIPSGEPVPEQADAEKSVLGKLELVQKTGDTRPEPLARLLTYF